MDSQDQQLPERHCGARVCGMHPQHPHTVEGRKFLCPGSGH